MSNPHVDGKSELIEIDVDQILIGQVRLVTYQTRVRAYGNGNLSTSPDDRAFRSKVGLR